jgi:hypothetical protein
VESIALERTITSCGYVCSLRPLALQPDMLLVANRDGKVMQVNVHSGQIVKTLTVGRGAVIEMAVIERRSKYLHPILMTCCKSEPELLFTKSDSGMTETSKARISGINFGGGIGPKVVAANTGVVAIVSQSPNEKEVNLYDLNVN